MNTKQTRKVAAAAFEAAVYTGQVEAALRECAAALRRAAIAGDELLKDRRRIPQWVRREIQAETLLLRAALAKAATLGVKP